MEKEVEYSIDLLSDYLFRYNKGINYYQSMLKMSDNTNEDILFFNARIDGLVEKKKQIVEMLQELLHSN